MECAIVLNGTQVVKMTKTKKFNKVLNNPNMKVLEECSSEDLEDRFNHWKEVYKKDSKEPEPPEQTLYHFKNDKTGHTITSIYPDLEDCKSYIKDWNEYRREY